MANPHSAIMTRVDRATLFVTWLSGTLWVFFSSVYVLLRSNQYTAVDGALRCLGVYWRRRPYLAPNNHMLYPFDVWLWWRFAHVFGFRAPNPISFLHITQAMNAVAAGGCVAIINFVVWRFTGAWMISLGSAATYAMSWAVLRHGTNSAEPLIGLFMSLLAAVLVVEGMARDRLVLLFLGGVALALALANYESMFLVTPLLYTLCLLWRAPKITPDSIPGRHARYPILSLAPAWSIRRLIACGLGTVSGVALIYSIAYSSAGIKTLDSMLQAFFQMGGAPEVYGGFRPSKFANLPVGLVASLVAVVPGDYQGLRWLLAQAHNYLTIFTLADAGALLGTTMILLALSAVRMCRSRKAIIPGLLLTATFCFDIFPLLYWDPIYDKLWLQPLALGSIFAGVLVARTDIASANRISFFALILIALEMFINLPQSLQGHLKPTTCLQDAQSVDARVGLQDKVITDFDPVSSLWMGLYDNQPSRTLLLPATPADVSLATIESWRKECALSGCRVFFIALLDMPRQQWDAFLGNRIKVPFTSLDRYRQKSRKVLPFACEHAALRLYDPAGR